MKYHVYRVDHTGRGIQHNPEPLPTPERAVAYLVLAKAAERANPVAPHLNPRPVFYPVAEDASGQCRAYPSEVQGY